MNCGIVHLANKMPCLHPFPLDPILVNILNRLDNQASVRIRIRYMFKVSIFTGFVHSNGIRKNTSKEKLVLILIFPAVKEMTEQSSLIQL